MLNENMYVLLGDYINAAVNVGFRISTVEEPMLPHNWKSASLFRYENYIETPTYLILIEGVR